VHSDEKREKGGRSKKKKQTPTLSLKKKEIEKIEDGALIKKQTATAGKCDKKL